jgi:hypothetical protein
MNDHGGTEARMERRKSVSDSIYNECHPSQCLCDSVVNSFYAFL